MGCDIHMWAEARKQRTERLYPKGTNEATYETNEYWLVGKEFPNDLANDEKFKETGMDLFAPKTIHPYDGRNYDLFAWLADVRNGSGFAGSDTGDRIEPLAKPRGVPSDATEEYRREVAYWDGDGHSHSYFSLQELLDADRTRGRLHRFYINPSAVEKFKETGELPEMYFAGGNGKLVTLAEYDEMHEEDRHLLQGVQVEWTETIYESAQWFFDKTIPALQEYADREGVAYDDIRIVFFFDN